MKKADKREIIEAVIACLDFLAFSLVEFESCKTDDDLLEIWRLVERAIKAIKGICFLRLFEGDSFGAWQVTELTENLKAVQAEMSEPPSKCKGGSFDPALYYRFSIWLRVYFGFDPQPRQSRNPERDDWIVNRKDVGKLTFKQIRLELKEKHPEWEQLETVQAVFSAYKKRTES